MTRDLDQHPAFDHAVDETVGRGESNAKKLAGVAHPQDGSLKEPFVQPQGASRPAPEVRQPSGWVS